MIYHKSMNDFLYIEKDWNDYERGNIFSALNFLDLVIKANHQNAKAYFQARRGQIGGIFGNGLLVNYSRISTPN